MKNIETFNEATHHLYDKEFYHYLIRDGFSIYSVVAPYVSYKIRAVKEIEHSSIEQQLSSFNSKQKISEHTYFSHFLRNKSIGFNHSLFPTLGLDFHIYMYKKYPEHKKPFIKFFSSFGLNIDIKKDLFPFIDSVIGSNDDIIPLLKEFPLKLLTIDTISPELFVSYLTSKNISEAKINKFLFDFYSARSNQIVPYNYSEKLFDFLLMHYQSDEKELEKYFPISSLLASKFKEIPVDIFETDFTYTHTFSVNTLKMLKSFCIHGWNTEKYLKTLPVFFRAAKEFWKMDVFTYEQVKKSSTITVYTAQLSHNHSDINKKMICDYFIQFFRDLKQTNFDITHESVLAWLCQQKLKEELKESSQTSTVRMKI